MGREGLHEWGAKGYTNGERKVPLRGGTGTQDQPRQLQDEREHDVGGLQAGVRGVMDNRRMQRGAGKFMSRLGWAPAPAAVGRALGAGRSYAWRCGRRTLTTIRSR